MDKHSIGKTIAQLRKAKGWTQAELAEQLNVIPGKYLSLSTAGLPKERTLRRYTQSAILRNISDCVKSKLLMT